MRYIRRWLYRRGHRPKPGSIWFSPSLALIYAMKDVDYGAGFRKDKDAQ